MTRILTYNILVGGENRVEQLTQMISCSQADIVGLVEATNPLVIEELAQRLNMHHVMSGRGTHYRDWQMAVLSRLPIIHTQIHSRPDIFMRKYLLEVCLQEDNGTPLTVFVIHQPTGFLKRPGSRQIRWDEIQAILDIMAEKHATPHLLMGDFNSIAPGDLLKGSDIVRYGLEEYDQHLQHHPEYRTSISRARLYKKDIAHALLRLLLNNKAGCDLIDWGGQLYGLGGIDLLLKAGYTDSFRHLHPKQPGFTFPASFPGCRIDYLFASPELAKRLTASAVIADAPGIRGNEASDHLPVYADFT